VSSSTKEAPGKVESQRNKSDGEYTMQEVSKHNTENDVWVVVEDQVSLPQTSVNALTAHLSNLQVLDVTKFLPEHPGGAKAILLYAGKDATEEFLMLVCILDSF
jgi:cytochrome b involved in lipid metabolism